MTSMLLTLSRGVPFVSMAHFVRLRLSRAMRSPCRQPQSLSIDMPERGVMPFSSAYCAEEAWIIGSTIDLSVAIQSLTSSQRSRSTAGT